MSESASEGQSYVEPLPEKTEFIGPALNDNGTLQKFELAVGSARSLTDLSEYVFFTPAVLYLWGDFYDGPLLDFMWERRENVKLYYKIFRCPVFRGLCTPGGPKEWNHVLWAVRRDQWQPLCDFLLTISLSFSEEKRLVRYGERSVRIDDPLAVDASALIGGCFPRVSVTAFGVISSQGQVVLKEPTVSAYSAEASLPGVVFLPPSAEAQVEARALYGGYNPLDARLRLRTEKKNESANASRIEPPR